MKWIRLATLSVLSVFIAGLFWISMAVAGRHIEVLPQVWPSFGHGVLGAFAGGLTWVVSGIREWIANTLHWPHEHPRYKWLDFAIVFNLALLIWLFIAPFFEGIGQEEI
jgi:hypothetical protein